MPVEEPLSYGKQIAVLKRPVVLVSLLAAGAINAAMFGFYSFMAEFLGSSIGLGAALVSALLLVYGLSNVAGNIIAGKTLGRAPYKTMIVGPLLLILLYVLLLVSEANNLFAAVVVVLLGIVWV